jgi:Tol biopolymer transport system component
VFRRYHVPMGKKILALLFLLVYVEAAETPSRWTPELAMEIQTVGSVIPSPDGRLVAWTQTCAVMESEKSEMISQIYLGRTDGSRPLQLTRGEKSASAPSFSPDGSYVHFLSARSGKQNLWRIPVAGGEAELLTDWKGSIGAYKVSPDGKWIAFAGVPDDQDEEKAKKEKRDFRVVDENPKNHGLWVIPAEAGATGTRSPRKLFANTYHVTDLDWTPDSHKIAFEHQPTPNADEWRLTDISEVDVESGAVRPLAVTGAAERTPLYSPDGRYLAYTVTSEPVRWGGDARIALLPRQGGQLRVLPASYDERPLFAGWSGDSSTIYFSENKHTRTALYAMPVDGVPKLVYEPKQGVAGPDVRLNAKATHAGFACESLLEPPEACVMPLSAATPTRVSRANMDKVLPPIGETKLVHWKAKDGLDIEGLRDREQVSIGPEHSRRPDGGL